MQIDTANNEVRTNINDAAGFTIDDSPVIFQMFSNTIYENKREAVVREVISNAVDSHKESGTDRPVKITLPNYGNPNFIVEDFGVGLSLDEFKNTFTCYTKSPKRLDNQSIGGFGIGAKSPYAYTNSFNVRIRKDGIEQKFMCYMNENSEPVYKMICGGDTDEPNGVEVTVPVKARDHHKFHDIVSYYASFFDMEFEVQGTDRFQKQYTGISSEIQDRGFAIRKSKNNPHWGISVTVVMGGVPYPYSSSDVGEILSNIPSNMIRGKEIFISFDIGELKVSLSRESLSLDENTDKKVKNKLEQVASELIASFQKELDECDGMWEAYAYMYENFGGIRSTALNFKGDSSFLFSQQKRVKIPHLTAFVSDDGNRARTIRNISRKNVSHYSLANRKVFVVYREENDPKSIQKYGKLLARKYKGHLVMVIREPVTESRKNHIKKMFSGIGVWFVNINTLKKRFDSSAVGKSGVRGKVSDDCIVRGISTMFDPYYTNPTQHKSGPVDVSEDTENTVYLYDESMDGVLLTVEMFDPSALNHVFYYLGKNVVVIGKNGSNEIRILKKNNLQSFKDFMLRGDVKKAIYKASLNSIVSYIVSRDNSYDVNIGKILEEGGDSEYTGFSKDLESTSKTNVSDQRFARVNFKHFSLLYKTYLGKDEFFSDVPDDVKKADDVKSKIDGIHHYTGTKYQHIDFSPVRGQNTDLLVEMVKTTIEFNKKQELNKAA